MIDWDKIIDAGFTESINSMPPGDKNEELGLFLCTQKAAIKAFVEWRGTEITPEDISRFTVLLGNSMASEFGIDREV